MPALRRSGTGVLETKREEKIYIDKKNGGGDILLFLLLRIKAFLLWAYLCYQWKKMEIPLYAKLNKYRASGTALRRVTNGRSKASTALH